jgi:predicted metalloendopeptidase
MVGGNKMKRRVLRIPGIAGMSVIFMTPYLMTSSAQDYEFGTSGLNLAAMDRSIRPGGDFFLFSDGAWYARASIPGDRSEIGLEQETSDKVQNQIRALIEEGQKLRRKNRDDALRAQATMDTHSPARFRAIGGVRNIDAWYRAFNLQETAGVSNKA